MSELTLRLARTADNVWIADMSKRLVEKDLPWSWTPVRVARHIHHRECAVLTANIAARPVGFAIMHFGDDTAHLSLLSVESDKQHRGIGRQLLSWLEASAVVAGTFAVNLEVRANNAGARSFYRNLGYREVGQMSGYYNGIEDAVRMAHDLRAVHLESPRLGS